jgi:predicted TIM-barrel fold metal-dependent hydrolase
MADANVDLKNAEHLERVRRVYQAANAARLAIASHVATQDPDYGREHAAIYLDKIFPMAPDIPIQIVHLAGHGPATGGQALIAFAEAAEAQHPAMRNVYIDVSGNMQSFTSKEELALIAKSIRQFGVERVLFGTDRPASGPAYTAKEAWTQFRRLHLTEAEFRAIADNIPPYMEDR